MKLFPPDHQESRAATCNGLKKSVQSLQRIERSSTASATQRKIFCNLQVADKLQRVTCPLCNFSRNFFTLTTTAQSRIRFDFL